MTTIKIAKELGEAVKRGDDILEIEGDVKNAVIRIRATGKVAWMVAVGAIAIGITAILATAGTGGLSAPLSTAGLVVAAPAATAILGGAATYSAIIVAVTAGGVWALNSLRNYEEIYRSEDKLILKKR